MVNKGKVVILMATYNGEKYLAQQLESIANQTHREWELWMSDDGSTDRTKQIFQDFSNQVDNFCLIKKGPRKGFSSNFLSLIQQQDVQGDYYAFSDQDDIWKSDKLERAIKFLKTISADKPALYCSRTCLIDENNKPIGFSSVFSKKLTFVNALVQSVAGGNTMVFNKAALELFQKASKRVKEIISHDWWIYMLMTGSDNTVFFDDYPTIYYRQHSLNQVGSNASWYARLYRGYLLLIKGRLKTWTDINLKALSLAEVHLTKENKKILKNFSAARLNRNFIYRIANMTKLGLYRQKFYGNIGLFIGMLCNKI